MDLTAIDGGEGMKMCLGGTLAVVGLLLLSGCATSIGTYEQRPLSDGEAIVLIGVDSDIPFSEARYCSVICVAWYELGGRKEIMAFPASVGSTFRLNKIYSMDNRVAPLKGEELKVERRGIYYYGTIRGTYSKVGIQSTPDPRLLLAARRKYGTRFDNMEAVNFTWPDAADDRYLGIGYQDSPAVQTALRTYAGRRLQLTRVAPAAQFDPNCRGGGSLSLPDFLPYEEYIRRAFNHELQAAQIYDEKPGTLVLTGAITELAFSSMGESSWKIGLRIETPDGRTALANVIMPYKAAWAAASACPSAEDAVPNTVQKLIEVLVASPEFRALLSGPAAPAASR